MSRVLWGLMTLHEVWDCSENYTRIMINYVDAEALGKARVFDIFIGDWGRHEDNWKWAGYDRGIKGLLPHSQGQGSCFLQVEWIIAIHC